MSNSYNQTVIKQCIESFQSGKEEFAFNNLKTITSESKLNFSPTLSSATIDLLFISIRNINIKIN